MLADLAGEVRSKRLTARALVNACITRISENNGELNAVVATRFDLARQEADAIDSLDTPARKQLPLCGLPVLVKDIDDVAGMQTTHGSLLYADAEPALHTARIPALLQQAGAIIVGKTNTSEFAFEGYSSNRLFGSTVNPWGHEWSPGGSSGGSSAAISAGLAAIATGTDCGGSVRIPASMCGLFGFKPTNGLIGRDPVPAWLDLHTDGVMTQSVDDARLLMQIMAGPVHGDNSGFRSLNPIEHRYPRPLETGWRRILATPRLTGTGPLPAAVAEQYERQSDRIATLLNIPVEHLNTTELDRLAPTWEDDWYTIIAVEQAQFLGENVIADHAHRFDSLFGQMMEFGLAVSTGQYIAARRRCFETRKVFDQLLEPGTVLLCPTMVTEGYGARGQMADGTRGSPHGMAQTVPANLTGHPAASIPAGQLANGLPFGIHAMVARGHDDSLLQFAAAIEAAAPWPHSAPGYTPFTASPSSAADR